MRIPNQVRVGAQYYTITGDISVADENATGDCNTCRLRIRFDPSMPTRRQQQTLVHEVIEAINHEYDVKLEHHQIEQLECALYQVITDNPEMFEVQARSTLVQL